MQGRMQWRMRALCAAAVLLPTACVPAVPYGQEPAINSPAFAVRIPAPGRPGYLQTIKFVDDGMRYVDRDSQFFISPAGEMCFRIRPNYPEIIYDAVTGTGASIRRWWTASKRRRTTLPVSMKSVCGASVPIRNARTLRTAVGFRTIYPPGPSTISGNARLWRI